MRGISLYNAQAPKDRVLNSFQGTIEDVEGFDPAGFQRMAEEGFSSARLAPNLLDAPARKGVTAAKWEADLAVATQKEAISLAGTYFHKILKKMGRRPKGFAPHCNGLSGNLRFLTLNIDSMQLSQMCSFVSPASMTMSDLAYNIYSPALWEATYQYMRDRVEMLKNQCAGCSVLGMCQGACVYPRATPKTGH